MNKETFQILIENLNKRITDCEENLPTSTAQLEALTLKDARNLKNFVHTELETMDRIVMIDLYHVIGMGNLSPQQMMQFTYAMQGYMKFRPTLKSIEGNGLNDLENLPKIPIGAKFRLLKLAPICLQTGEGEVEDDVEEFLGDLHEDILVDTSELPYTVDLKRSICIKKGHLEDFCSDLDVGGTVEGLDKKIRGRLVYLGINWKGYDADGNAHGIVSTVNVYNRLIKILREKYKVSSV